MSGVDGAPVKEGDCIFPFVLDGQSYSDCAPTPLGAICATETITDGGDNKLAAYGYCGMRGYAKPRNKTVRRLSAASKKKLNTPSKDNASQGPRMTSARRSLRVVEPQSREGESENVESLREYFASHLEELADLTRRFASEDVPKAKRYADAAEAVRGWEGQLTDLDALRSVPGIGAKIVEKLKTLKSTGEIPALSRLRKEPVIDLTRVYGLGPKKARQLVDKGITSIDKLRENVSELNNQQRAGLEHLEAIESRIPRSEIDTYKTLFDTIMKDGAPPGSKFEIVGSYRRGAATSGDIDVILTNENNDRAVYSDFIDQLISRGLVVEVLTRGKTKTHLITQLPDGTPRRVDVMYAPPNEYAFATLYFTGSKAFNVMQRQRALDMGYTLNEHGIRHMVNKKAGKAVEGSFPDERSIFDFLGMSFREPPQRADGMGVRQAKAKAPTTRVPTANTTIRAPSMRSRRTLRIATPTTETLLRRYSEGGVHTLAGLSEVQLSEMTKMANEQYYCNNDPILTDEAYDTMTAYLLAKHPTNTTAMEGHTGCKISSDAAGPTHQKTKLPYEMWSMDKIRSDPELQRWAAKYPGPYVLSCKLDGVSGLYTTEGPKPRLYTRGTGVYGQDVSHIIPYLELPTTPGLVIRGEFIVKKGSFAELYASEFKNARNFVAGLINQRKSDPDKLRTLDFVAYELIKPAGAPSAQLNELVNMNIQVAQFVEESHISEALLGALFTAWRNDYEYDVDGVVVAQDQLYSRSSGNPEHAFAFKMALADQIAETKVANVIWTASKDGYLVPRVQIEPVVLGGTRNEFASGFNAKFIVDHSIGKGATIQIIRSGDVIPHILGVPIPASKPQMPSRPFVWTESGVDIMVPDPKLDAGVQMKVVVGFFSAIDAPKLKTGNVAKLFEKGYTTVHAILSMSEADFETVFSKKTAQSLYAGLHKALDEAPLPVLMQATNVFGRGFGTKTFASVLNRYPDILTANLTEDERAALLLKTPGLAKKTAPRMAALIPVFVNWMREAGLEARLQYTPPEKKGDPSSPLFGKRIVTTNLTPTVNKTIRGIVEASGGTIGNSVTSDTFLVVAREIGVDTEKGDAARTKGIEIITAEEFITRYQ